MILQLRNSYVSRYGTPSVFSVDTNIFVKRYFTHCMQCGFCQDSCCSFGVDVDINNVQRIEAHAEALEKYVGIQREDWFRRDFEADKEFPGGNYTRTQVINGACAFLNRKGRGCLIHSFCLQNGIDYHELKPMVSCLFPVTFDDGLLHPANDVDTNILICLGDGPTLYRGVRSEILYYFGHDLVLELDEIENCILQKRESL